MAVHLWVSRRPEGRATAYAVIIAAIVGYAFRLWVAERAYRRQMETLLGSKDPRPTPGHRTEVDHAA